MLTYLGLIWFCYSSLSTGQLNVHLHCAMHMVPSTIPFAAIWNMTETRSRKSASWLLIWMTLKTMSKTFLWLVGRSKTRLNTAIIPKVSVKHAILWPWLLYYFTTWSIVLWARRGTAPELYRSPWQAVKPIGMSHIPPIPHPYNPVRNIARISFHLPKYPQLMQKFHFIMFMYKIDKI